MFGLWSRSPNQSAEPESGLTELTRIVKTQLPDADAETIRVVAALAGILGAVAYADREISPEELVRIQRELLTISGMTQPAAQAVTGVVARHAREMATVQIPHCTRTLRELGDEELREQILGLLVHVAAADGTIRSVETTMLRQLTTALGLPQDTYNALQARFRDQLEVLGRSR